MQNAAKRVINTLGVSDYFTVIQFNSEATVLGNDKLMIRATDENKAEMVRFIDKLKAVGATRFYGGFDLAFRTFDASDLDDKSSSCNRAILFLSDGVMNDDNNKLLTLIKSERAKYVTKSKHPPILFTYSFGAEADDSVPKQIACDNDGIWAKISDGGDLAKSMGAYCKYFAYGLSAKINEGFVAWVEPYEFSTGVGIGISASAPVYDRIIDPPVLLGVVGIDINFAALERAFGGVDGSQSDVIDKMIQRSGAVCPRLNVTKCQLESLRKYGSDDIGDSIALCSQCSSTIKPLKAPLCPNYANDVWNNRLNQGRTYEERTCCHVGAEPRTLNIYQDFTDREMRNLVCKEGSSLGLIVGLIVGVFVFVLAVVYFFLLPRLAPGCIEKYKCRTRRV